MFRRMLDDDRRQAGWSIGQAAWRLGIAVREYRELEAGERLGQDLLSLERLVRLTSG